MDSTVLYSTSYFCNWFIASISMQLGDAGKNGRGEPSGSRSAPGNLGLHQSIKTNKSETCCTAAGTVGTQVLHLRSHRLPSAAKRNSPRNGRHAD